MTATRDLMREVGFARLTVDGIAESSGVAKATIYRWWNNRADVAMAALLEERGPAQSFRHEGSALANLRTHLREATEFLSGSTGRLLAGIVADAQHDPQIAQAFLHHFLEPRRELTVRLLDAAGREGELRADVDHDLLVDMLIGPFYYRLLLTHGPISAAVVDDLFDMVLFGVRPSAG